MDYVFPQPSWKTLGDDSGEEAGEKEEREKDGGGGEGEKKGAGSQDEGGPTARVAAGVHSATVQNCMA